MASETACCEGRRHAGDGEGEGEEDDELGESGHRWSACCTRSDWVYVLLENERLRRAASTEQREGARMGA